MEQAGEDGVVQLPIYACDGFEAFATLATSGTSAPRAMLALSDSALYVVSGTKLVKLNAGATEAAIRFERWYFICFQSMLGLWGRGGGREKRKY